MTDTSNAPGDGTSQGDGNNQGGDNKPWYDGQNLSAEDIGFIQNRKYENLGGVIKNVQDFEKMKGVPVEQLLQLPKDLGDDKAMGDVYKRLGRPEAADKYTPLKIEGIQLDEGRTKWADNLAFNLGLNQKQRDALFAETVKYESALLKDAETKIAQIQQTQLEGLKTEWGQHFPEREELARRSARMVLPGDDKQKDAYMEAMEGSLGTAAFLKLFANIGEKVPGIKEDKMHGSDGQRPFGYTKEQAMEDIRVLKEELKTDPKRLKDYNNNTGPDVEKMKRLHKIAYPQAA